MKSISNYKIIAYIGIFVLCIGLLLGPAPAAHAGFWDWVSGVKEIPSDVDELKSKYNQMEESFQKSREQYEAYSNQLMQENEQLRVQGEQLRAQNEALTSRLQLLEEQDLRQKERMKWIIRGIVIAASIIALFFIMTRVTRVLFWRRHR